MSLRGSFMSGASIVRPSVSLYLGEGSPNRALLLFLGAEMPAFRHWMVCAFGQQETACVTAGALLGGHARVGFENDLLLPNGTVASGNQDLVAAARHAVEACGLAIADADTLRSRWTDI